jgi:hypothetical protein
MYPKRAFTGGERMKIDNRGEVDIISLVSIVVVSAVSLLIGFLLMNGMDGAISPSMETSVLSTSQNIVLNGFGDSSVMLAIGLFVLVALGIVMILGGVYGRSE